MKAVLLSDKKTGSTFVQYAIGSHPELICYDEMFLIKHGNRKRRGQLLYKTMRKEKKMGVKQYLDWLYSQNENVCFRLMYPHDVFHKVLPYIMEMKIPIIHLVRQNHFKKTISKYTLGKVLNEKINIRPDQVISGIKESINRKNRYERILKNYPYVHKIKYENMIGSVSEELNINKVKKLGGSNITSNVISYMNKDYSKIICDLFGVEYKQLYSNVTKKNKENIFECLTYKRKIKRVLRSHKFEQYLEM